MAQIDAFNTNEVEAREAFELMPAGDYLAIITESDVIDTKNRDGKRVKLVHEIQSPAEYKGRKVWAYLNTRNKSAAAEKIGQQQLKEVCDAVGFAGVLTDTVRLHNKPLMIKVVIQKDGTGQYADQNEIKGWRPAAQQSGRTAQPAQRQAPAHQEPAHQPAQAQQQPAQQPAEQPTQPLRPWQQKRG